MNCVLLTSNSLRHKYVSNKIANEFDLELIITEEKSDKIEDTKGLNEEDKHLIKSHFKKRASSENIYFSDYSHFPKNTEHIKVANGKINSQFIHNRLLNIDPDAIFLFGTSIIKPFILKSFKNKIINLHLGLSPYYKGSGTNLWPLYFDEPECVGTTIHLAEEKVDAGAILYQLRPDLCSGDTIHDIGNKTIKKAGHVYPQIVKKYLMGEINPQKQTPLKGKTLKISDFTPSILRKTIQKIENGLIKDYLSNKKYRDNSKPIVH